MKSDLVDLDLSFRHETDDAFAVWNGDRKPDGTEKWVWLTKKYTERDGDIFTMPEWLAIEKGLV